MKETSKLNIVVALPCEARFFLDQYRLKKIMNSSAFQIFSDSDKAIHLIVSGVGKIKSAAATAYLHALTGGHEHTCYLNAGIAGCSEKNIGELFLIHKITDDAANHIFYPTKILSGYVQSLPILTVDYPRQDYAAGSLIDMEAAGFFSSAVQFVTQEQVAILKIISDSCAETMNRIRPEKVIEWFKNQREGIDRVVQYQRELSALEVRHTISLECYDEFISNWHFTVYQKNQLKELLRRWAINFPQENPLGYCREKKTAQDVLMHLERDYADSIL